MERNEPLLHAIALHDQTTPCQSFYHYAKLSSNLPISGHHIDGNGSPGAISRQVMLVQLVSGSRISHYPLCGLNTAIRRGEHRIAIGAFEIHRAQSDTIVVSKGREDS
jgi:hypothetical protein